MKILFKNRSFGGGAPKSLLAYIKIAREAGMDVVSLGAFNYDPVDYTENAIRTLNIPYFILQKPIYNFRVLKQYLSLIKKEQPDIIHATTLYNLYFQYIVEKLTGIPTIYMIPGGQVSAFAGKILSTVLKNKKLLVYSEENRLELLSYEVRDENIIVIPNRIDFKEIELDDVQFSAYKNRQVQDTVKTLMITRFSETKINSIRYTIELTKQLAMDKMPVELTILGSGFYLDEIKAEAELINREVGKNIIHLPGYQNNVQDFVREAHIIYGKGRSVIDGIVQKKLSAVVNEENQLFLCTSENFKMLSDYNLTGRNELDATGYEELKETITKINTDSIQLKELDNLYHITQSMYDINVVKDDIIEMYNQAADKKNIDYAPTNTRIFKEFCLFYLKIVLQLIKR